MELHQLRTFVTVGREGHLTRAAELLCLSQPAVSAHVKALEDELGLPLFQRNAKGMTLTPAGERLLEYAEKVLAARQELLHEAGRIKGAAHGRLRIGTVGDADLLRLGPLLAAMAERHPHVTIQLRSGFSATVIDDVLNNRLDAGFTVFTEDPQGMALTRIGLMTFSLRLAAPAIWRERVEGASWEELAALSWIGMPPLSFCGRLAEAVFRRQGGAPRKIIEADRNATVLSLIAAGTGIGLLHEEQALKAEQAGEVILIPGLREETRLDFIVPTERRNDLPLAVFQEVLREVWAV
ncbi:MAG: LysR family transcriptional regulator [Sulfuricella sp.]|nr:LysR family transcriptional regulator [Sulfuricella sp.]